MEPGRIRLGGTGGSAQCAEPRARRRAPRRAFRARLSRMPNNSDNNGRTRGVAATSRPDTSARARRARVSLHPTHGVAEGFHLRGQGGKRAIVRRRPGADHEIDRRELGQLSQKAPANELAQSPFEPVAVDGRVLVARHNESDARMRSGRGRDFGLQVRRAYRQPNALSRPAHRGELGARGQPIASRKRLTRRRTSRASERSTACVPFSDDDSTFHAPSVSPSAHGIRAS
jgi:hypothetical protein